MNKRFSYISGSTYRLNHHSVVIISTMASQITGVRIVCSIVCLGADQRKRQSSASLAFVMGIHRSPVNFPSLRPVTRKTFPFDGVIMDVIISVAQQILLASLERKHTNYCTVSVCKKLSYMGSSRRVRNRIIYVLSWRAVYGFTLRVILVCISLDVSQLGI